MPTDMYSKIEKKILDLKQKEDFWKRGYKDLSQQVRELVHANSKQIGIMERAVSSFQSRIEQLEKSTKKTDSRGVEIFSIIEKRLAELSDTSKSLSARMDEKETGIKSFKADVLSQVSALIAKHEKTFDSTVERIGLATNRLRDQLAKQEGLYDRMESAKRFFENYRPPQIPDFPRQTELQKEGDYYLAQANGASRQVADPPFKGLPAPPLPERLPVPQSFIYEPQSPPVAIRPRRFRQFEREGVSGHLPAIDFDPELDDDLDVDDVISGRTKSVNDSVGSMNTGMAGISQKLASIEDSFSKMQNERNVGVGRLEDKIRMYSQSVADVHSRMGTLEKAMKDGMTPMMEAMKILTETVKTMKDEQNQILDSGKKVSVGPKASRDAFTHESAFQPTSPSSFNPPSTSRRRA